YPYTGGLRFDVDANQAKGSRVSNIEARNATSGNWEPLDLARTYKLFTLSFVAGGGDGYATLASVPADRRLDVGVLDADVLQAYLEKQARDPISNLPLLTKVDASLYSTKSYIAPK
ncbi:MAG: bifunctional metallophosphatase/5'-nucleotidase, partial [Haliea sp.]